MSYLGRSGKLSLKAQEKVSFLATAGQTSKTGLSYTPSFIEVYVNGVLLTDTTDFTATNGSSVTFTVALLLNDEVTVISLKTFTVADHYTKSDADTLLAAKSPLASPSFTGSVGIGTSSPLGNLSVEGNGRLVTIGDSGSTNVPEIKATNAAGTGEAFLKISAYEHRIGTNSTQRLTVQNNGHVKINTGNLIIGTSGQGIDFSANADSSATGASTTSELLDSYEEGTFTPTFAFSGQSVSVTYGIRGGTYTKVGRLVTGALRVQLTDKGSSNGDAQITGLPYVCNSTNGNFGVAAPAFLNNWSNNNMGSSTSTIDGGTSIIRVRYLNSSGAYANITQSQVSNNADIIYVFSYLTN